MGPGTSCQKIGQRHGHLVTGAVDELGLEIGEALDSDFTERWIGGNQVGDVLSCGPEAFVQVLIDTVDHRHGIATLGGTEEAQVDRTD